MYELWHVPSGNALAEFSTLDEALDVVHEVLERQGREAASEVAIFGSGRHHAFTLDGDELLAKVTARSMKGSAIA